MPTLTLYRPTLAGPPVPQGAHPKVSITAQSGLRLVLPYAPREIDRGGYAPDFAEIERTGRTPLVRRAGLGLPSLAFDVLLAGGDHQAIVAEELSILTRIAAEGEVVTVAMNDLTVGTWRVRSCQVKTALLQHGTNAVTRAVVSLSFTAAVDAVVRLGPVTGGAQGAPAVAASATARTHRVSAGQTLSGIAVTYYGAASKWPKIAEANGIRDPRRLAVGATLTIPAL